MLDKEKAELARAIYDTWQMVKESAFGLNLLQEITKVKERAVAKSFRGNSPESVNEYLESRGSYKAMLALEAFFSDIESANAEAVAFLSQDVKSDSAIDTKE